MLPLVVDSLMYAASIKCSEDEVDLSNWNSSPDAYTFLYNPDLWQQGGKVLLYSLHLTVYRALLYVDHFFGGCRGHSSCSPQDCQPGGSAAVELGHLEVS